MPVVYIAGVLEASFASRNDHPNNGNMCICRYFEIWPQKICANIIFYGVLFKRKL